MKPIRFWCFLLAISVLLLASLACAVAEELPDAATEAPASTQAAEAPPAVEATSAPETAPEAEQILLNEQFVDNSNNWFVGEDEYVETVIEDGKYRINTPTDGYNWFKASIAVSNVDVTVDTEFVEGEAANSDYGVMCRVVDADNHYRFKIASDGVYRIDKQVNGEISAIVDWTSTDALLTGAGVVNTMRVICNENHLILYINGTLIADVVDSSIEGGSFALMAGAYVNADNVVTPAVVNFSNLIARQPMP
jgi:hypothetical protein